MIYDENRIRAEGSGPKDRDERTMERGRPETRKMIYDRDDEEGSGRKDQAGRIVTRRQCSEGVRKLGKCDDDEQDGLIGMDRNGSEWLDREKARTTATTTTTRTTKDRNAKKTENSEKLDKGSQYSKVVNEQKVVNEKTFTTVIKSAPKLEIVDEPKVQCDAVNNNKAQEADVEGSEYAKISMLNVLDKLDNMLISLESELLNELLNEIEQLRVGPANKMIPLKLFINAMESMLQNITGKFQTKDADRSTPAKDFLKTFKLLLKWLKVPLLASLLKKVEEEIDKLGDIEQNVMIGDVNQQVRDLLVFLVVSS
nr:protein Y49E10.8 [imported] - Caenorhabditis elegans [Caenorhabditis elegans]